jgi:hypothetical protein
MQKVTISALKRRRQGISKSPEELLVVSQTRARKVIHIKKTAFAITQI